MTRSFQAGAGRAKLAFHKTLTVVAVIAAALWMGGMLALGAIAAPVIFGTVPAPMSADAMTVVFRRFDRVAIVAAAVIVLVELLLAVSRRPIAKRDGLRGLVALVAAALAVWQASALSPKIEALHRAGAIRGLNDLGVELEATHHLAELCGKSVTVLLVALIALHVFSRDATPAEDAPGGREQK